MTELEEAFDSAMRVRYTNLLKELKEKDQKISDQDQELIDYKKKIKELEQLVKELQNN